MDICSSDFSSFDPCSCNCLSLLFSPRWAGPFPFWKLGFELWIYVMGLSWGICFSFEFLVVGLVIRCFRCNKELSFFPSFSLVMWKAKFEPFLHICFMSTMCFMFAIARLVRKSNAAGRIIRLISGRYPPFWIFSLRVVGFCSFLLVMIWSFTVSLCVSAVEGFFVMGWTRSRALGTSCPVSVSPLLHMLIVFLSEW